MNDIEQLTTASFAACVPALADLLIDTVDSGASVGFLTGLDRGTAAAWWHRRAADIAADRLRVWVTRGPDGITGTISLAYADKDNARHRAEVVKLAVRRSDRGRGTGRRLLATAELAAAHTGITLLLLDTETGSAAEHLYRSAGWQRYGVVPHYAADPAGTLRDCSFYYKQIRPPR